jgi:hypothetical protein
MAYFVNFDADRHGSYGYFNWDDDDGSLAANFGISSKIKIDPERLSRFPTSATHQDRKKLADFMMMPGSNACNQRFKNLVERFEPGVHLFHPITLNRKNGTPYEEPYYIFSAQQGADFILTKMSGMEWWYGPTEIKREGDIPYPPRLNQNDFFMLQKSRKYKIFISSKPIKDWHIYTGNRAGFRHGVFFSDEFYAAIKAEKIQFLKAEAYCDEVDVPWDEEENFGPALQWIRENTPPSEAVAKSWAWL